MNSENNILAKFDDPITYFKKEQNKSISREIRYDIRNYLHYLSEELKNSFPKERIHGFSRHDPISMLAYRLGYKDGSSLHKMIKTRTYNEGGYREDDITLFKKKPQEFVNDEYFFKYFAIEDTRKTDTGKLLILLVDYQDYFKQKKRQKNTNFLLDINIKIENLLKNVNSINQKTDNKVTSIAVKKKGDSERNRYLPLKILPIVALIVLISVMLGAVLHFTRYSEKPVFDTTTNSYNILILTFHKL